MNKRAKQVATWWMVGALLLGPFWAVGAQAQEPIKVGASISLTGSYAKLGSYTRDGYLLCEKEINEKGGLLGRKIQFVIYDDKSEPPTAIKLWAWRTFPRAGSSFPR